MFRLSRVLTSEYGETFCENCKTTIKSDGYGNMPNLCPGCGFLLDYEDYEVENEQEAICPLMYGRECRRKQCGWWLEDSESSTGDKRSGDCAMAVLARNIRDANTQGLPTIQLVK